MSKALTPAQQRAEDFLTPVIEGTSKYGAKKQLALQLSKVTGKPVSRSTLEHWLRKDRSKRREPSLGDGLLLREVFDRNNKRKRKVTNNDSDNEVRAT